MPNWCSNVVTVYADTQRDLEMLLSMANKPVASDKEDDIPDLSPFRMEAILTTPIELMDNGDISSGEQSQRALSGDTSYEYDNWYDWRIAHWGTKWDMDNVELDEPTYFGEETGKKYSFDLRYQTAWSPNIEFWKYVCRMGPFIVEMRYIEEGMGYIGETTITKDNVYDYCINITTEMLESVGGVIDDTGEIDWGASDINEWDLFPLKRERR
jgi:hypothetical protein